MLWGISFMRGRPHHPVQSAKVIRPRPFDFRKNRNASRLARVVPEIKLTNGVFWPTPITRPVKKEPADSFHAEEEVTPIDAES